MTDNSSSVVYQEILADIRVTKRNFWSAMYYCFLLQGAIVYLSDKNETNCGVLYILYIFASLAISCIAYKIIDRYQIDLAYYREDVQHYLPQCMIDHNHLTVEERSKRHTERAKYENWLHLTYKTIVLMAWLFIFLHIIANNLSRPFITS